MIAMGILAVGMGMVAGALHAGIQTHIRTIDDIMRQLIGDNALAIVQASLRHSGTNGITEQYQAGPSSGTSFIDPRNLKFPFNDDTSPYGAAVFIKTPTTTVGTTRANSYDVMIVPYRIIPLSGTSTSLGTAIPRTLNSCSISTSGSVSKITVSTGDAQYLTVGSAIIDSSNNQTSIIKSKQSDTVFVLWDKLQNATTSVMTLAPPSNSRVECSKPVQTKTALSPSTL